MSTSSSHSNKFGMLTVFVFVGFLMSMGMVTLTILNTDVGQYHKVESPATIVAELSGDSNLLMMDLVGVALDNLFIIGYFSIFYGIYLLTRRTDKILSTTAFSLGISTAIFDIIENSFLITLFTGVPVNFTPESLVFSLQWLATSIKDISSYISGALFVLLLLVGMNTPPELRMRKITLALFLVLYVVLGSLGIVGSIFLTLRNLLFVIDMFVALVIFYSLKNADIQGS